MLIGNYNEITKAHILLRDLYTKKWRTQEQASVLSKRYASYCKEIGPEMGKHPSSWMVRGLAQEKFTSKE